MKRWKGTTLHVVSVFVVIGLVFGGISLRAGFGTPSVWGLPDVAAICPLGGLEAILASKGAGGALLAGVVFVVVLTIVFGRAFCGWGCPVPLFKRLARPSRKTENTGLEAASFSDDARKKKPAHVLSCVACHQGTVHDSRNWVLGSVVLTTAVFGFPVFCLICPVGLTFATLVGLWHAFRFSEVTLGLVVFPAVLVLEVVVLRKWCRSFCPLGALLLLIAKANRMFRPTVDRRVCLRGQGTECRRCADACLEDIDLHHPEMSAPLAACTKCRACADACPASAIKFPLLSKKDPD